MRRYLRKLRQILTPSTSLTQQSIAGGVWMGLTNVLSRGLQIVMVLILANLLTPGQFGLMGIALLVISAINRSTRLGLNDALIYNENKNVNAYLNTAWMLNIGRGIILAGIIFILAPFLSKVFGEPRTASILPVMALGPLVYGFRNPGIVYFKKKLKFRRQFIFEVSGAVAQFVIAVGFAVVSQTVWALVVGYLATSWTRTITSYFLHDYSPRPTFDLSLAKELVDYGKWVTGSHALSFIKNEGDDAFIGWFLAAASLGYYQMAYRLANAPATEISHVVSGVAFPAYSKIQDDPEALRSGFLRVVSLSTLIAFPAGIGIAVVAPTFTQVFLGSEWLPMVLTMQLFALYGTCRAFVSTFGSVWRAVGRPDLQTKMQAVSIVGMGIGIYPATQAYGIAGAAATILLINVVLMLPLNVYVTVKEIEISVFDLFSEVIYPTTASAIMGIVVLFVSNKLILSWAALEFVVLVVVGMVTYLGAVAVLETRFNWGLRAELRAIQDAI